MGYKGPLPATHYGAVDTHLDTGPGVVYWVLVQAATASAILQVRDGSDDAAEIIAALEVQAQRGVVFPFAPPLPYERGLYIDPGGTVASFVVAYDHLEP